MRKIIPISLLVFIAVVAGGYCIFWFSQAAHIKSGVEQAITRINAQRKYVTYDTIETSGFPSQNIYVSIVRPHFSGRIDPILKAMMTNPAQADMAASIPRWDEDDLLNGRIIIGVNALSDNYSLRTDGNWQRNSTIGGRKASFVSQSSGDTMCTLKMAHTGGLFNSLWDYHALTRDNPQDFLQDMRQLDCNGPAAAISDAASHQTLVTNGPWRIYITNAPNGTGWQGRLYVKFADVEVTPQGDAMVAAQRSAFTPSFPYPVQYSLLGKQNMEIDASYAAPSDLKAYGNNPPVSISLSKFNITNQMYTSDATFYLNNSTAGSDRKARIAFKAQENFSAPYDAFLQAMMHGFVGQMYAEKGRQLPQIQPYLSQYTPDQMAAILTPLLPNLHSLGQLVQSLDISYKGAPDLSSGDVTLADLELSASPYGIKGNGSAKRSAGQMLPESQAMLTCNNCSRLVDDAVAYVTRLKKAFSYFETPQQLAADHPIDPRLADGIKTFLKAVAAPVQDSDPNKDSLIYAINSDAATGVTINGRHLSDVLAMYNEYVAPLLRPQPAAGAAAPADMPASAPAH